MLQFLPGSLLKIKIKSLHGNILGANVLKVLLLSISYLHGATLLLSCDLRVSHSPVHCLNDATNNNS